MAAIWCEITAKEILVPINGNCISGVPESLLTGLSTDSRKIRPGELFWALKGEQYDGHDFALKAIEKGAAGIVVQEGYWNPEWGMGNAEFRDVVVISVQDTLSALGDLAGWWRHQHSARVVAITGSTGKTTTKEMVAGVLELGNSTLKNQGNLNNLIGMPLTLLRLEKGHDMAVLEMGMNRAGEIARLTEIADPDVGVITNVGMAHLEGLLDIEGVVKAKAELVQGISAKGRVAVNGDDELLLKTASIFRRDITTFGLGKKNDVRATAIRNFGKEGISFDLEYHGDSLTVRLRTPGLQNVYNALAAATIMFCLDEHAEHIVDGLGKFEGIKGRFTVRHLNKNIVLVDDTYNANPLSLKAAIDSVDALIDKGEKLIVGLGEMMELGNAAAAAHEEAGRMVAKLEPDCFVAIGEHAPEMAEGAVEAGIPRNRAKVVKTHDEMVRTIRDEMREGCLIFLKGSRKMALEKVVEGLVT